LTPNGNAARGCGEQHENAPRVGKRYIVRSANRAQSLVLPVAGDWRGGRHREKTMQGVIGAGPVQARDRIASIDTLRGVALLGILIINIIAFGLVSHAFSNPIPDGALTGVNFWTYVSVDVLFEGSMRAIFAMLFGAGVILFTARGDSPAAVTSVADLYYKRTILLILFGLLDAFLLLWTGDILYIYGVVGLFLFPLRNVRASRLLTAALVLLALGAATELFRFQDLTDMQTEAAEAQALLADDQKLDDEQQEAIDAWQEELEWIRPKQEDLDEELAMRRSSYFEVLAGQASEVIEYQAVSVRSFMFWDAFITMVLGMALYKYRVFGAGRSYRFYTLMTLLGFAVGLPVNAWEVYRFAASNYDIFSTIMPTYDVGRLGCAFGYIGLVMLFCKSGILSWLRVSLAAVGRMALTNYLAHSIICALIFSGVGFGLVGELQRYQLYYVVGGIWLVQLIVSPLWLRQYRFGPAEWLWRSLTYGTRQPMRN
jgi:uncharacterized protein